MIKVRSVSEKEDFSIGNKAVFLKVSVDLFDDLRATIVIDGIKYRYREQGREGVFRGPGGLIIDEKEKIKIIRKIKSLIGKDTPLQRKITVERITNGIQEQGRVIE